MAMDDDTETPPTFKPTEVTKFWRARRFRDSASYVRGGLYKDPASGYFGGSFLGRTYHGPQRTREFERSLEHLLDDLKTCSLTNKTGGSALQLSGPEKQRQPGYFIEAKVKEKVRGQRSRSMFDLELEEAELERALEDVEASVQELRSQGEERSKKEMSRSLEYDKKPKPANSVSSLKTMERIVEDRENSNEPGKKETRVQDIQHSGSWKNEKEREITITEEFSDCDNALLERELCSSGSGRNDASGDSCLALGPVHDNGASVDGYLAPGSVHDASIKPNIDQIAINGCADGKYEKVSLTRPCLPASLHAGTQAGGAHQTYTNQGGNLRNSYSSSAIMDTGARGIRGIKQEFNGGIIEQPPRGGSDIRDNYELSEAVAANGSSSFTPYDMGYNADLDESPTHSAAQQGCSSSSLFQNLHRSRSSAFQPVQFIGAEARHHVISKRPLPAPVAVKTSCTQTSTAGARDTSTQTDELELTYERRRHKSESWPFVRIVSIEKSKPLQSFFLAVKPTDKVSSKDES